MNPLLLDILPLLREKYCCSQILILMALHARGEENSGLIRACGGCAKVWHKAVRAAGSFPVASVFCPILRAGAARTTKLIPWRCL